MMMKGLIWQRESLAYYDDYLAVVNLGLSSVSLLENPAVTINSELVFELTEQDTIVVSANETSAWIRTESENSEAEFLVTLSNVSSNRQVEFMQKR